MAHITGNTENEIELVGDERRVLRLIARTGYRSLDEAETTLRAFFRGWFIYRGGHHVALHRASGEPRLLLLTEPREEPELDEMEAERPDGY